MIKSVGRPEPGSDDDGKGMRVYSSVQYAAGPLQSPPRSVKLTIPARLMRHILVDHARKRSYQKRGGDLRRVTLDEALIVSDERAAEVLALDDALTSLAD